MIDAPRRILHSAIAAVGSQFWRIGVTFATTLVLRRLIEPADWGILTWSEPIFVIVGALRDLGLPGHVVRARPRPWGAFVRLEAWFGLALTCLMLAVAPLLVLFYAEPGPEVTAVLRALSLVIVLEGLAVVPLVFLEAELEVRKAVFPEVARNLCYAVTALSLAATGYGLASVVLARVLSVALFAALLWARTLRRIPLQGVGIGLGRLLRGSLPISLAWFLCLINSGIDPLIIGASSSREALGVYGFAYFVALLASTILIPPVGRVAYAAMVAYRDNPERAFSTYRLATLVLLAAEVPVAFFLFVNANAVLDIMGGDRWLAGAPYLRILCFVPLVDPFSRFGGDLLLTRHEDRRWVLSAAVTLLWFLTAGVALTRALGPTGMALADLLPLGGLVMALSVRRASPPGFAALVRALAFVYLAPLPLFLAAAWLGDERPALCFALSLLACLLTALVYHARLGGDFRRFLQQPEPGSGLQTGATSGDTRGERGGP